MENSNMDIRMLQKHYDRIPYAIALLQINQNKEKKGFFCYVNHAMEVLFSKTKEEFIAYDYNEFIEEIEEEVLAKLWGAAYKEEEWEIKCYHSRLKKSFYLMIRPYEIGYVLCSVQDMTQSDFNEEVMNSSFLTNREIYYIDLQEDSYCMIYPNKDNALETGNFSDAIIRHFETGMIHPYNRESIQHFLSVSYIKKELAHKDNMEYKYRRKITNGKYEWCLTSISVGARKNGIPQSAVLSIRSIDHILQKEKKEIDLLQKAVNRAQTEISAKSDFLFHVSKDIREPLNVIFGMSELAQIYYGDEEKVRNCLLKINSFSKHLLALANDVLDISNIEKEEIEIQETPFMISSVLQEMVRITQALIASKQQVLIFEVINLVHEKVMGDKKHLLQILLNILVNAIKFSDNNKRIVISINETEYDQEQAIYEITIRDQGAGMSEEFLSRLFEPYATEIDSDTVEMIGAGLGMPIARRLIEAMKGEIQVSSKKKVGSVVIVKIPLRIIPEIKENETYPEEKVLLIDSIESCIHSFEKVLDDMKTRYFSVFNGKDALRLLKQSKESGDPFTCVTIDYILNDMNGIEVAKLIRKEYSNDIPILMISAYNFSVVEEEAIRAGVNYFLTKPVFRSDFENVFQKINFVRREELAEAGGGLEGYNGIHALLVEDNMFNIQLEKELLEFLGVEVVVATNGQQALDCFFDSQEKHYQCIFMDLQMPDMNGFETAMQIRSSDRADSDILIFPLTANVLSGNTRKEKELGMKDNLVKPISLEQLEKVLHKWFPDCI